MNPKAIVSAEDQRLIREARDAKHDAEQRFREVVVAVAARSSIRSAAEAAEIAPSTVSRWIEET